jgi:hypothetical protein
MDIDVSDLIELTFEIESFDGASYELTVNNHAVTSNSIAVDLTSPMTIKITKSNEGLINIKSIKANNYEIMPYYMMHSSSQTNRLSTITSWHLSIAPNLFTWLHNVSGDGVIA